MINRILLIVPVVLLFSVSHLFADLQKGLDAYNNENYATALNEWRPLAEEGNPKAQYYLGVLYHDTNRAVEGVPPDWRESAKWYALAAEQGHRTAQFHLGIQLENGLGIPEDRAEAVKWYRLSAEQGYAPAQSNLGNMYERGSGIPEDKAEAVKWYTLAAEQGDATEVEIQSSGVPDPPWFVGRAQFRLGLMYDDGDGVPQDHREAVKWYSLAAERGLGRAQFRLGVMYANGRGVPEDKAEAVKWYSLAAEQGWGEAGFTLGRMYDDGDGVPEDDREAVKWHTIGAEQRVAESQNALGLMYYLGAGVPKDDVYAHMWFNIASSHGQAYGIVSNIHERARENKERVADEMTPSQIEEAEALLRKCLNQRYRDCE